MKLAGLSSDYIGSADFGIVGICGVPQYQKRGERGRGAGTFRGIFA